MFQNKVSNQQKRQLIQNQQRQTKVNIKRGVSHIINRFGRMHLIPENNQLVPHTTIWNCYQPSRKKTKIAESRSVRLYITIPVITVVYFTTRPLG